MSTPRLEIDLDGIARNARTLVDRLSRRGISVTGVTKATLGSPDIARAFLRSGVKGLGDSRIENIERLRRAGIGAPVTLVRSPMPSQVRRVVEHADTSFNTELEVVAALSAAARRAGRTHRVVLMVELGDLREGILPADLHDAVRATLRLPNIVLEGIGTNLACRSGVVPDRTNMAELSALADALDAAFGRALGGPLRRVSGGNSANLGWALGGADRGRVDDLRLGESILLGRDPLHREAIEGLHTDAIRLVAEVIESKEKPSRPWGDVAQGAFGSVGHSPDRGPVRQALLALGRQDVDPDDLYPPPGISVRGASSDHLVVESGQRRLDVGAEVTFGLGYGALLRAMTSPFVARTTSGGHGGGVGAGPPARRGSARPPPVRAETRLLPGGT